MTLVDGRDSDTARDRHFNPWRSAWSEAAKSCIKDIIAQVEAYEEAYKLRKRARRLTDQATFEATIEAIICDLIHHQLKGSDGAIMVPRSKQLIGQKSRYRAPALNKTLSDILDRLSTSEVDCVEQELGQQGGLSGKQRTTIRPGKNLIRRIEEARLSPGDLGQSDAREVIILKALKVAPRGGGEYLEYEDTKITEQYRKEVREINEWLACADIHFDDAAALSGYVDRSERRLRRVFTRGRFDSGGRLFGGFWQSLKKKERLAGLVIDGDAVVELDYDQMAPTILYGLSGVEPPEGDLYSRPWAGAPTEPGKAI